MSAKYPDHQPAGYALSEADICRKPVVPKLQSVGWDIEPDSITEQRAMTDGRIVPVGKSFIRKAPKHVDYHVLEIPRWTWNFNEWKSPMLSGMKFKPGIELLNLWRDRAAEGDHKRAKSLLYVA
jgi:hypothetical protein